MTQEPLDFAELRGLLDALCEETITAEQLARLEHLLLTHVEAEAYYVQHMSQLADLARHFGAVQTAAAVARPRPQPQPVAAAAPARRRRVRRVLFAMAG